MWLWFGGIAERPTGSPSELSMFSARSWLPPGREASSVQRCCSPRRMAIGMHPHPRVPVLKVGWCCVSVVEQKLGLCRLPARVGLREPPFAASWFLPLLQQRLHRHTLGTSQQPRLSAEVGSLCSQRGGSKGRGARRDIGARGTSSSRSSASHFISSPRLTRGQCAARRKALLAAR